MCVKGMILMLKMVAITPFGVESIARREMTALGFDVESVSDGRIYFNTDSTGVARANVNLRTVERIYHILDAREVRSFDELFDWIAALSYRKIVDPEGAFIVNAQSKKSTLYSLRDIQKITKKALIEAFKKDFGRAVFNEQGEAFDFLVHIDNDRAELLIDTSGEALHKRGYRKQTGPAPIKETLAAALVMMSFYEKDRILIDPFCGSGTIPIEAAMIAKNIAPGLNRDFAFTAIPLFGRAALKQAKRDAFKAIDQSIDPQIEASDIDRSYVEIAKENAFEAGVDDAIRFHTSDFRYLLWDKPHSVVITNPPYGKRLGSDSSLDRLYKDLGHVIRNNPTNSFYVMTPYVGFEKQVSKKADRTRVLFNGRIKTRLYQYFGPPPHKK